MSYFNTDGAAMEASPMMTIRKPPMMPRPTSAEQLRLVQELAARIARGQSVEDAVTEMRLVLSQEERLMP